MILENIFYGNIHPTELGSPKNAEYKQLSQDIVSLGKQLDQQLSPAARSLLEKYLDQIYSAQLIEAETQFSLGFSLGMGLQKEVAEQLEKLK